MEHITVVETAQEVVEKCEYVYLVIPTAYLHDALQSVDPALLRTRYLVSAIKGFISYSDEVVTDYLEHVYQVPNDHVCVISGPTHAEEIAREKLTFLTVASQNRQLAETVRGQLRCRYINLSLSEDLRGIQFASALKNVYAVAAGFCKGIGGGDNLMAVLVSYSMAEMQLFYHLMQPDRELKMTSELLPPFLGDLLVTCYSQFSRNRTLGTMIGMGYSVKSAMLEMQMVAEGYYAVKSLENIRKKLGVEMPIAQAVYMVLYEGAKPDVILRAWQIYRGEEGQPRSKTPMPVIRIENI
jgi:glycerol-3-phosphate dehydrogenase (NAD(P)+)